LIDAVLTRGCLAGSCTGGDAATAGSVARAPRRVLIKRLGTRVPEEKLGGKGKRYRSAI
jgi:hypothetical protein